MESLSNLPDAATRPSASVGRNAAPFDVRAYSSPSQIEREWRQLEAVGTATVFQRYDWIDAYVRHVLPHKDAQPAILLGRLDGHPAFILPLATFRVGPLRVAAWIGDEHAGYNFGLWSPDAVERMSAMPRSTVRQMLKAALGKVDCAILERMPRIQDGVAQPLSMLAGTPSAGEGYPFDLTGGLDEVLAQRKATTRLKRVRTRERRLDEAGGLRFRMTQDLTAEREALEFFFEQKARRLSEQGKSNGFDKPGVKDFYRDLLQRSQGMREPVLEIAELSVGGRIRAVTGSGIHHGRVNSYFTAFAADELSHHSPGNILTFRHIEHCCEKAMPVYDLGIGYEEYKTHWCQEILPLDDRHAAFTPLGAATVALMRLRDGVKSRMRRNRSLWKKLKAARAWLGRRLTREGRTDSPAPKAARMASVPQPAGGSLDGARMLFVAPDDYPAFRVDLVELFSNHLVGRGLAIDWSLRPNQDCAAGVVEQGRERFHLARRAASEKFGGLRYKLAESRLRLKLAWRAARGDFDLVQVRDQPLWVITFALASRISGTPCVFWMSYPVLEGRLRIALKNLIPMSLPARLLRIVYALAGSFLFYRVGLPLCDHIIVQSKRMRERVGFRGIPLDKMTPVPMGVSTGRYNPASVQPANDPRLTGRKCMAYMSADVMSLMTHLTFEALADLVAKGYDAVLVIIGSVPDFEWEALNRELEELGIADRVIFTGRLPLAEALGWVKRADVCLSPFMMDPAHQVATPTKLVEYLAMGRPVVGTVHYDQNEVILGSGAGYVTAFSGKAMAEGVARLFDDPEKAEAMGAKGPAWIKAHRDYAHLADTVEQVYLDLLAKRRQARPSV